LQNLPVGFPNSTGMVTSALSQVMPLYSSIVGSHVGCAENVPREKARCLSSPRRPRLGTGGFSTYWIGDMTDTGAVIMIPRMQLGAFDVCIE
jgi:hypothetical protein